MLSSIFHLTHKNPLEEMPERTVTDCDTGPARFFSVKKVWQRISGIVKKAFIYACPSLSHHSSVIENHLSGKRLQYQMVCLVNCSLKESLRIAKNSDMSILCRTYCIVKSTFQTLKECDSLSQAHIRRQLPSCFLHVSPNLREASHNGSPNPPNGPNDPNDPNDPDGPNDPNGPDGPNDPNGPTGGGRQGLGNNGVGSSLGAIVLCTISIINIATVFSLIHVPAVVAVACKVMGLAELILNKEVLAASVGIAHNTKLNAIISEVAQFSHIWLRAVKIVGVVTLIPRVITLATVLFYACKPNAKSSI